MASEAVPDSVRLAALCSRLGRLTTERNIDEWDVAPPPEKLEECSLFLVGMLLSNPSINFPAFQTTIKKAWRVDRADFTQ